MLPLLVGQANTSLQYALQALQGKREEGREERVECRERERVRVGKQEQEREAYWKVPGSCVSRLHLCCLWFQTGTSSAVHTMHRMQCIPQAKSE